MRTFFRTLCLGLLLMSATSAMAGSANVRMEDMTWMEIRDAIASGKTTVILPTGGTEQNGPHIVLGKHNIVLNSTAEAIARSLGDTLVAPVLPYVPEGSITPPAGHMMFAGTLSLQPQTFAAVLEDSVRSLKQHGFKTICLIGEHGASQDVQRNVAEKLSAEWRNEHVQVLHISDYYDTHNGQNAALRALGETDPDPQAHGGLADTSEMLAVSPRGVRDALRGKHTPEDFTTLGVDGSSDRATGEIGLKLIDLKVQAAVKQIQKERLRQ